MCPCCPATDLLRIIFAFRLEGASHSRMLRRALIVGVRPLHFHCASESNSVPPNFNLGPSQFLVGHRTQRQKIR